MPERLSGCVYRGGEMKGSSVVGGLRGKRVGVGLIALVCSTFLFWGWDRAPSDSQIWRMSPDIHHFQPEDEKPLSPTGRLDSKSNEPPINQGLQSNEDEVAASTNSQSSEPISLDTMNPIIEGGSTTPNHVSNKKEDHLNRIDSQSPVTIDNSIAGKPGREESISKESHNSKDNSSVTVNESSSIAEQGCDYAVGKWVYDERRPMYSGKMCKRWLSGMWACRLTQRTDFSYEKYRWQPDKCEMADFSGENFLSRMKDKTLAFIGDSLGRQQFQSMMCLITGGQDSPDVIDVGIEYGLVQARGAVRPDGWAYRFPNTNTTVLYYWSASLCEIVPINHGDPSTDFAMHLDRPATFLRDNIHRFHVVVLNTGHHWNRGKLNANRWKMYAFGKPVERKLSDIKSAHNLTVHRVVKWLDSQLRVYPELRAFMRTISPRHFFNGDWNSGGSCDNTKPLAGVKQSSPLPVTDPVAESAVQGTNVELLNITPISQLRDEAHLSKYSQKVKQGVQDCLHWCLPGVPDTWNELLFSHIVRRHKKLFTV